MGFWSTLGKIAPFAALAIPGVGPAVGAGLKGLGVAGAVAGIGAGTQLLGAKMQSSAAGKAAEQMQQYNQQALDFLKAQDARDFAEYEKERARLWGQQDIDRQRAEEDRQTGIGRFNAKEGRLTPYRDFGQQGVKNLSSLLTIPQGGVMYQGAPRRLADLVQG